MARLHIQPLDIVIDVPADQTIMQAAGEQGYYWPTTCDGEARCSTCALTVLEGADHFVLMGERETRCLINQLGPGSLTGDTRLACQARLSGDATVLKHGVQRRPW